MGILFILAVRAADIVGDIVTSENSVFNRSVFKERVIRISDSNRIMILTNDTSSVVAGDYVTLLIQSELAVRAVVAKVNNNRFGIKILKLYSTELWNQIHEGMELEIIRGDDSGYLKEDIPPVEKKEEYVIQEEKDLFDSTILEEDEAKDNENRIIKSDNIFGASYGNINSVDERGRSVGYRQILAQWQYQIEDNIWLEAIYGTNYIRDFPALGIDTRLDNFTIRAKFTVKAPMESYILPYVGYQLISPYSPGAGQGIKDESAINEELTNVKSLGFQSIIGGVSFIKRLVPGWFAKCDIGTDILSAGFAFEF
jgi:hypothetical protein